jgi:hypothetical protein
MRPPQSGLVQVSLPGIYSARGNGAHYIFIIPTLDMVIVHRTDNDSPVKDAKTITEIANRASPASENRAQFGHLVKVDPRRADRSLIADDSTPSKESLWR